jgi:hypothetical protein
VTFKRGQSGNPGGRSVEKLFAPLFRAIGNEIDPKTQRRKARLLCEKVYALALKGEPWAVNCVLDRIDGRPASETALSVTHQQDIRVLSDDELMAIIAKQKAESKPEDKPPPILQ